MNPLIAILGMALLSTACVKFVGTGVLFSRRSLRRKSRTQQTIASLKNSAEIARLNSELQAASSTDTSGLGWRVMEVAETVDESEDCRSFYLTDPYGQDLPPFSPGQYLMVRPALPGAYQPTRCYSLSSAPDSRFYRISVKRQQVDDVSSAWQKNGGLSLWLHEYIQAGDCLLIGGPSGHFFLPAESREPLVLLAAGIGITPMASMLRWSLEQTPDRPVILFYQAKDLDHWSLGKTLHGWEKEFPNCRVISYFSRCDQAELDRELAALPGGKIAGKYSAESMVATTKVKNCHYYMCGPDGWMTAMQQGLMNLGVEEQRVHWESFGGVGAQPKETTDAREDGVETGGEYIVEFAASELSVTWEDPEQSLWELAKENSVEIPSGCLSGVCGSCKIRLKSGTVQYDRPVTLELADDECLACVAQPSSDLCIDA